MPGSDDPTLATSDRQRDAAVFWRRQLGEVDELAGVLPESKAAPVPRRSLPLALGDDADAALARLAGDTLGRFTVATAAIALGLARYFNRERVLLRTPLLAGDIAALNGAGEVPLVFACAAAAGGGAEAPVSVAAGSGASSSAQASGRPPRRTLRQFLRDAAAVVEDSYSLQDHAVHAQWRYERGVDLGAPGEFSLSHAGLHAAALTTLAAVHFRLDHVDDGRIEIDVDPGAAAPLLVEGLASVISATLGRFADLSTAIGDIPRPPPDQRDRLIRDWNRTAVPTPFASVHARFEQQVRQTPDATALRSGGDTLSYGQLNELANRLAHHLIGRRAPGAAPTVGIWMDRSPWMVVAVLGVLKAGLAYMPIDADCPPERLAFLVRDSGIGTLLIDEHKTSAAAALACSTLVADGRMAAPADGPATAGDLSADPGLAIAPSDLAYVIYTSGSTGQPKGCAVEHHSLANYLAWAVDFYWTAPGTGTMGLFTPLSFDLTVPSLFCPLLRGRTLVIGRQDASIDQLLRQQFDAGSGIDTVKLTPSHIRVLGVSPPHRTGVRLVIVGGEALTAGQVAILHRIDPDIRVVNEYGPTEVTVGCIAADIAAGAPITIGRPIANTRAYVLDEDRQLVPIGVRGELCIGGAGVARGYLDRPALERERFLADPFVPGGRLYRTGDVARWLPDGELECFGRIDRQVKVRGYRVELEEVEAALRRCRDVHDAVVAASDDGSGAMLVAYVVSDGDLDPTALLQQLAPALPSYMWPSAFIRLAELPLTANGKIDRGRLPEPRAFLQKRRPSVAPRTATEQILAGIWEEVLRLDRLGVDEDFFELGGHSLRAMAMMPRIHQALGVEVSIGEILSHPSIAALATVLEAKAPSTAAAIAPAPAADHYPVSHGQRRLWLIDRIDAQSAAYNVSSAFDIRGGLDLDALGRALDALIARHESLRTVFIEVADEPRQRVLPELRLAIARTDLRGEPEREERLRAAASAQASQPFDLATGPLLRVGVFQLEDDLSVLAVTMHHIVSDAWSMRVLIDELVRFYESGRTGADAGLADLPIQYRDYAFWQRRMLDADRVHADRDYWLTKLGGELERLALPSDCPRPAVPSSHGGHHRVHLDAPQAAALRSLGAAHGASPFMTLVAVVKTLLHRYTGQRDIRVGMPIAGRVRAELAGQIGFYVNTLVLRDEVRGAEPFVELLARVKQTAGEAYEHQAYPFDRLVDELGGARDIGRTPVFDVMVVHDTVEGHGPRARGLSIDERRLDTGISKFDLTLAFAETPHGIDVEIEYRTELYAPARIARLASHLRHLVASVIAGPATPVDRLDPGDAIDAPVRTPAAAAARGPQATAAPVAPRDDRELALVGVLESVLGRPVSVADHYFHAGGDSIGAIQVVNRLARQGWALRVRDLFEAPEVEALARRLSPWRAVAPPQPAAGRVPLTPIQRWFFLTQTEGRSHYNQSVMLRLDERVAELAWRRLGAALVDLHDALRLRYRVDGDAIAQVYDAIARSDGGASDPVGVRDLRQAAHPVEDLERHAAALQASLDIERGPLARFVLFQLPDGDRLLAIVHHLAVDGVSWRILLEDLRLGLAQAARHEPIALGPRTDSYQTWSLLMAARARDAAAEREWWDGIDAAAVGGLPFDDAGAGRQLESGSAEQLIALSDADTRALLTRVHQAYNTRMQDVLLAALAAAFREWAGPGAVRLDVEGHGRDDVDGIDVSRTVGWFTTLYPVVLDLGNEPDPGRQLTRVKDTLRRTPGHGFGYGLLRGGRPSGAAVLFNFLGQFDADIAGLTIAEGSRGPEYGPSARMTHALAIGGWIAAGRLHITMRYSRQQFRDETLARLLAAYQSALERLIAHCRQRGTRQRTAADVRYADGTTAALVERLGAHRVEDVYPLSPMQLGLLYHSSLAAPDAPVYVGQFSCRIGGRLDGEAFRAAWEAAIRRHAVLRTAFFQEHLEQPLQVVFASVDAPWSSHDWRAFSDRERAVRLEAFAAADRRRGLDLATAPVSRFTLIRTGDEGWRFYWTSHHILLDGWSTAIVLQDVFAAYQSLLRGDAVTKPHTPALSPQAGSEDPDAAVRPFGEYIDWLRRQDPAPAAAFWRERLHDFTMPTPLPAAAPGGGGGPVAVVETVLTDAATASLAGRAREQGLTLNTLARGTWALLLAAHSGHDDVVYGATVAGRPAALPGVETMAGLFINTLPIRVRIEPQAPLAAWLHRLQIDHADLDQHSHASLADIQQSSGVPRRSALFDSLLVFENYPVDQSIDPGLSALTIDGIGMTEETGYPLTLAVVPGDRLVLRLSYDTSRYSEAAAIGLLREMESRFAAFVDDPQQTVGAALVRLATAAAPRCRVDIDDRTLARLRAVAAAEVASVADAARALAAMLCFRYAANEDLRCEVDAIPIGRHDIDAADPFAAVLRRRLESAGGAPPAGSPDALDLSFHIVEAAGRVAVEAVSPSARFDEPFLRRTGEHLAVLTAGVAAEPQTPVAQLPLLPAAERSRLLDEFNRTDKDWGPERTMVQRFEDRVAEDPDRIAVVVPAFGREDGAADDIWTYGELNTRANQLARRLVGGHGVGPDVRVGVLAERSLEMVLALVAIEKAGGAYVPLDPEYPPDLLRFMIEDSGAPVILTQTRLRHLLAAHDGAVICLDAGGEAAGSGDNLPSRVTGDSLAYVIYTSGSTGRPKGAMNTHRGIANRLLWMQEAFGLTAEDRVLQKTPFSFDVSVWEFFWPLMTGARLVVARPGGHRDPSYLVSVIAQAGITTLHFVPSMLQAFIDAPGAERCDSLTRVVCSGEALTAALVKRYFARLRAPLHNLYGPTEAAVDVTAWRCDPDDTAATIPIGRPIANLRLYVLDALLQPAPEGVTGELYLAGVGVGRGYLNRPELTRETFVPDPFAASPGARMYRTGDLARYRSGGIVDFLGRIDHQVKLRGFRIELGEIESALLSHHAVRDCVVVVREDSPGVSRLVAYVVLAETAPPAAELGAHLRRWLPEHMTPGVFVPLVELPRLTNGKLDRHALPVPEAVGPATRRRVAPRAPLERRLARVWEDVLGHAEIGVTDDFFELGGHSILAMKMVSAVEMAFGRRLPLAQVLTHSTIERLAVLLGGAPDGDDWQPLVEIRRGVAGRPPLFLLPGAGGNVLYFHALAQRLAPGRAIYGLQATGLDGRTAPLTTVEAIAAANIDSMRRAWPAGPYYLAGHSFGGHVALDMAQQLARQGEAVGLLALLDTAAPDFEPVAVGVGWQDAQWLAQIAEEIEAFFAIRLGITLDDLLPLTAEAQLTLVMTRMQQAGVWAGGADRGQLRGYLQVYKANMQAALVRYDAVTRVPVALFKAAQADAETLAVPRGLSALRTRRDWGWDRFARGAVRVFDVPGAHLSMLTPQHAPALAQAIDAALASAEATPAPVAAKAVP